MRFEQCDLVGVCVDGGGFCGGVVCIIVGWCCDWMCDLVMFVLVGYVFGYQFVDVVIWYVFVEVLDV